MSLPGCNESEVGARVHRDAVHVHLPEGFVEQSSPKKTQHLLQDNRGAHHADASNEKESGWTVEVVNPSWYWHIDLT